MFGYILTGVIIAIPILLLYISPWYIQIIIILILCGLFGLFVHQYKTLPSDEKVIKLAENLMKKNRINRVENYKIGTIFTNAVVNISPDWSRKTNVKKIYQGHNKNKYHIYSISTYSLISFKIVDVRRSKIINQSVNYNIWNNIDNISKDKTNINLIQQDHLFYILGMTGQTAII